MSNTLLKTLISSILDNLMSYNISIKARQGLKIKLVDKGISIDTNLLIDMRKGEDIISSAEIPIKQIFNIEPIVAKIDKTNIFIA